MANPIFQMMFNNSPQMNNIQQIAQLYKSGGNPMSLIQNMPQFQPIMQQLQSGRNPQELFYKMCQDRGVDPQSILNQFK